MRARLIRLAQAILLLGLLVVPSYAAAQDNEISFPPTGGSGEWEGLVNFAGFVSSDIVTEDGSFTTSVTDIIGDTAILVDFTVDEDGQVTSGQMRVDLTWFVESVGAAAPSFEPYHVVHDQRQTGVLSVSGDADRLVAAGSLTHTTNTNTARSGTVDAVSGTKTQQVEWVFHAIDANCVRVTAELVEAWGISIMNTVLVPRVTVGDGQEIHNQLGVQLWVYPADIEDPEAFRKALDEAVLLASELDMRDTPEAEHLEAVVDAWTDLRIEMAKLDECQTQMIGSNPEAEESWLVEVLQRALHKGLDNADLYDASELIDLWFVGAHEGAIDGDLTIRFLDAFDDKLDEAISMNDIGTITDILAWASLYGYANMTQKAQGALP